jgi:hypothetical protein
MNEELLAASALLVQSGALFEKADRLLEETRTGRQFHYLYCATNIISQLVLAFTARNMFFQ